MNPTNLGVIGPGFLNQAPTLRKSVRHGTFMCFALAGSLLILPSLRFSGQSLTRSGAFKEYAKPQSSTILGNLRTSESRNAKFVSRCPYVGRTVYKLPTIKVVQGTLIGRIRRESDPNRTVVLLMSSGTQGLGLGLGLTKLGFGCGM